MSLKVFLTDHSQSAKQSIRFNLLHCNIQLWHELCLAQHALAKPQHRYQKKQENHAHKGIIAK